MRPRLPSIAARGVDVTRPAAERYHVLGRIAIGGMAEIYLARMFTPVQGLREYVLKRLRPEYQQKRDFVQMFYDEAQIASCLRHPNIAQIIELGEIDGTLFISAELVRGVNVRELFQRSIELGKQLPLEFVLRIGAGVLHALEYAHSFRDEEGALRRIVHRDISPQNIIVTYGGEVKLVDFGVAKAEGRAHETRIGLVKGKPMYMAPEQLFGDEIDGRADLFALGEVLFEISLGRHPFYKEQGALMEVILGSKNLKPYFPEATFFPAAELLLRALEVEADQRFESAVAMREAIEELVQTRRLYSTAEELGLHIQSLFRDRLDLEDRARREKDDHLLIESLRVGSRGGMPYRAVGAFAEKEADLDIPIEAPVDFGTEKAFDASITAAMQSRAQTVAGRIGPYTIDRCIGRGAMAEVYRAHFQGERGFDRLVAVKRVLPHLARNPRFVDLFMSEARLAGRLTHPNIVQVLDVGSAGDDHYYAMEYVDGWDLATILDRCRMHKQAISVKLACRIVSDVCAGLHAAHSAVDENDLPLTIVHRDVAPQNVLISKTGAVKLTDFGIARADDQFVVVAETKVGEIRGKPAYMAPERLVPDQEPEHQDIDADEHLYSSPALDPRVDVFSAGAVLFEILALRPLFKRSTPFETLMAVQRDAIPAISAMRPDVPKALDGVIERACSRFKGERYPTALALGLELERVLAAFDSPVTPAHLSMFLTHLFGNSDADDRTTDPHMRMTELGHPDDEERTETHQLTARIRTRRE